MGRWWGISILDEVEMLRVLENVVKKEDTPPCWFDRAGLKAFNLERVTRFELVTSTLARMALPHKVEKIQ